MKKIFFLLILILLAIFLAEIASLKSHTKAADIYTNSPSAVQRANQGKIAYFLPSGEIRTTSSYDPTAFFPKGIYDADFGQYGFDATHGTLDGLIKTNCTDKGFTCESIDTLPQIKAANFNLVLPAGFYQGSSSEFNHAQNIGLKVLVYLDRDRYQHDVTSLSDPINFAKNYPALFGWYLMEEPYHKYLTESNNPTFPNLLAAYQYFQSAYNYIKTQDPNHPVFMLESGGSLVTFASQPNQTKDGVTFNQWLNFGDFFSGTAYGLLDDSSLENNLYHIDAAKKYLTDKPYLAVLQAQDWYDKDGIHLTKMPNPAEMRAQIYGSIIHGDAGYMLFIENTPWVGFGDARNEGIYPPINSPNAKNTDVWQAAAAVNSEVENANLKPAILSPTSTVDYSVSVNSSPTLNYFQNSPIHTMLKYYQGKLYLFTTNITGQGNISSKIDFPFQVNNLLEFNPATDNFENSSSSISGQTLSSVYSAYQVKVFRFEANQAFVEISKKQASNTISSGREQTYTVNYRNISNSPISNVHIVDQIPFGTTYVANSATYGGVINNGVLVWNLGVLNNKQEGSVSFRVLKN